MAASLHRGAADAHRGPRDPGTLSLAPGERWYVAVTAPRKERYAATNLSNQGYRSFLPQQRVTWVHARRFRTEIAPVFPRYLFVIFDPHKTRWRSINGTFGVRGLLSEGDNPLPVRAGIVETLVRSSGVDGSLLYKPEGLKPGGRIRLISGPFSGALGVLQSLDDAGRVRLLLEFVGGASKVTARWDAIEAAS
jgi:transcriptional antiterminator RfaH